MNRILALSLLLLAACPGDPPSTAPAASASIAPSASAPIELGTKKSAATAPVPVGKDCSALVPTSLGSAWVAGPFEVPGDDAEHSFALTGLAGPVLVAIQNGDGLGTGGTAGGEVWLSSAPERLALAAGQGHVAGLLTSAEGATLTARFNGGGTARVTLAAAGTLPCPLLDATVTRGGGTVTTVTKSVTRPDEYALGILVVEPSTTAGTSFEVSLNSVVVGTAASAGPALLLPVALNAGANSVVVRATGTAGGSARVRVLDLDTTPPTVAITTPVPPAMLKATPGAIKGTRSSDVKGVDLGGAAASLGTGTFSGTVALEAGPNGVVVTARDFCGNVVRDCRVVTLDSAAPVVDVTGVEDGAYVYGPVNLSWTVTDEHLASVVAKLNGVEVSSPQVVATDRLHTLTIVAKDEAANQTTKTVRFTIDTTPPTVSIGGVAHGKSYRVAVKPTWSVTDANLLEKSGKLDGADFVSATLVDAEGDYRLEVTGKDKVGNEASKVAVFSVDYTKPVITVAGVANGDRVNHSVTPVFSATDLHGATVTATLNGAKFTSGTEVTASRVHTLVVKAVDPAGNEETVTVGFTVDQIPPAISLTGVSHGQVLKTATPRFTVTDTNLGPVTATLNGAEFASGTLVSEEGEYRLLIVAQDTFGNTSTKDVSFAVDRTVPVLSVSGVTNGAFVNQPPTLTFGATDLHLGSVVGKLDGTVIASGHVVEADGAHTLVVTATDRAGNAASSTTRFTLDRVAPVITVSGVTDGQVSDVAVRPVFSATDAALATVSATLDGYSFKSGTSVPWGGNHVLVVTAVDKAGNVAAETVNFELTTGGPQIILRGVVNGQVTASAVTPTWDVPDASATVTATLNGAPFDEGTTVSDPGVYTLKVQGTTALSSNTVTAKFTIDQTAPVITIGGISGPVVQGPVVVTVTVVEPNVKTRVMTLNGTAFTNTVTVTEEGTYSVAVTVTDKAGNTASQSASFVIDRTPPVINVAGVTNGEFTRASTVLPTYTITDANPGTQLVSLNGVVPFLSGDAVTGEDTYVLHLEATDAAGNTSAQDFHFVIDRTPPSFTVEGLQALSDGPQTPVWGVSELHPKLATATLDGVPFVSGTPVSGEGSHTLVLHAEDLAGNVADRSETFVIDTQAPEINVSGVVDGERRNTPAMVVFGASDPHLVAVSAVLDGGQFTSGGQVSGSGSHTLVVTATDSLGHASVDTRTFVIETQPPVVSIEAPAEGLVTKDAQVEVVAVVTDDGPVAKVTLGGVELARGGDGKYRLHVSLAEGQNALQVQALDAAGNQADPVTVTVTRDTTAPVVSLTAPAEGVRSTSLTLEVSGTVTDTTTVALTIGGTSVSVEADGTFTHAATLVTGSNTITVRAVDGAGNETTVARNVRANATAPVVTITEPVSGSTTTEPSLTVRGSVTPGDPSDTVATTLKVDGVAVTPEASGAFTATVTLPEGTKEIRVAATDGYGLSGEQSVSVTRVVPADAGTVEPPDAGVGGEDVGAPAGPDAAQPPGRDAGAGLDARVYQSMDTGPRADGGPLPDTGASAEPAPVIALSAPAEGLSTNAQTVTVMGTVTGGTLPLTADVNGIALNVSGRSFNAVLTLAEGEYALTVTVTDRDGRSTTAQRSVSVDRTAPYLTVDVPATNPATVSTTPYRLEGEVGDQHLSSVTVSGSPATILAGRWGAWVKLSTGENTVTIEARDEAGNRSAKEQVLNIGTLPPAVSFLEPYDGAEAAAAIQHVRVQVSASATVADVQIGAGGATQTSPGVWEADVALALGDNVITAKATDANGVTGTKSITVHYRDETTEPLAVTGVNPAQGAMEVEPNALISVGFNKEIDPVGVEEHFKVLARGVPLEGEYLVARGAQIVTFAAKEPLPEGEVLTVRVWGTGAVLGPSQVSDFASQFTVRRPLTLVRGLVVDDSFRPLAGVKVDLGDGVVTRTGTDGNWATFAAGQGTRVVTYEGGTSADGRALPTVKRKIYVTPETTTLDRDLVLTPTNKASAQYVDSAQPVTLGFNGVHGALSVGLEENALAFPSGTMSGYLTATELEPYSLPVPLEGRAGLTRVWQIGPGGTHVGKDVTLRFPNVTGASAGLLAILFAYDDYRQSLNRIAVGRVTPDGVAIESLAPVPVKSIEFIGYQVLDEAMSQDLGARLGLQGTQFNLKDGGARYFELERWRLAEWVERPWAVPGGLLFGTAEAQPMLGYVGMVADAIFLGYLPAVVAGRVRAPRQRQLNVEERAPTLLAKPMRVGLPHVLNITTEAWLTGGEQPYPPMVMAIDVVRRPPAGPVEHIAGAPGWARFIAGGRGVLDATVELNLGEYTVTETIAMVNGETRKIVYFATVEPVPGAPAPIAGAPVTEGMLQVSRLADLSDVGSEPFEGIPVFAGVGVEVNAGGYSQRVATGAAGGYAAQVYGPFGANGISCSSIPLGYTMLPRAGTAQRFEHVLTHAAACSTAYNTFTGVAQAADVLVDARFLWGTLTFVDPAGNRLPLHLAGEPELETRIIPETGHVQQLSPTDVETTEVHFFRANHPDRAIAPYTLSKTAWMHSGSLVDPTIPAHHGAYGRIWMGPMSPLSKAERARCGSSCERDLNRLNVGEEILVVAVNHATGYTGMSRIRVPPITTGAFAADGSCPEDVAAGGPLVTVIGGQHLTVSRCTRAELGIRADIVLYPPEVEVHVVRHHGIDGAPFPARSMTNYVRHGGTATTRDDLVGVVTRWRVRLSPAPGQPETTPPPGTPNFGDRGPAGPVLEHLCIERPASPGDPCMGNTAALVDVPPAVPPLAGHYVSVRSGVVSSPIARVFLVPPGQNLVAAEVAEKSIAPDGSIRTVNPLKEGNWYVHVVGNRLWSRPSGTPFWPDQFTEEKGVPPPIGQSVGASSLPGLPSRAIGLKNVYEAVEPDGTRRLRFDRSREHEFTVAEVVSETRPTDAVTPPDSGWASQRPTAEHPSPYDPYQLLLQLIGPSDPLRTPESSYQFSIGGSGMPNRSCRVEKVGNAYTGTCDCEPLFDALTPTDYLFVQVAQDTNVSNVLYQYRFALGLIHAAPSRPATYGSSTGWGYRAAFGDPTSLVEPIEVCVYAGPNGERVESRVADLRSLTRLGCVNAPEAVGVRPLPLPTTDLVGDPLNLNGPYQVCVQYPRGVPGCGVTRACKVVPINGAAFRDVAAGKVRVTEVMPGMGTDPHAPEGDARPLAYDLLRYRNPMDESGAGVAVTTYLGERQPISIDSNGVVTLADRVAVQKHTKFGDFYDRYRVSDSAVSINDSLEVLAAVPVGSMPALEYPVVEGKVDASLPLSHPFLKNVDMVDGHVAIGRTDISVPARGLPLTLSRTYSSRGSTSAFWLGRAWSVGLGGVVESDSESGLTVVYGGGGSGQQYQCAWDGTASPVSRTEGEPPDATWLRCGAEQRGFHGSVFYRGTAPAERQVVYVTPNGNRFYFGGAAVLHFSSPPPILSRVDGTQVQLLLNKVEDQFGNVLQRYWYRPFVDGAHPQLYRVVDHADRCIELEWETQPLRAGFGGTPFRIHRAHLKEQCQPTGQTRSLGQSVEYHYDNRISILTRVRILGADEQVREETYAYQMNGEPTQEDNLRSFVVGASQIHYEWLPTKPAPLRGASAFEVIAAPWERVRSVKEGAVQRTTALMTYDDDAMKEGKAVVKVELRNSDDGDPETVEGPALSMSYEMHRAEAEDEFVQTVTRTGAACPSTSVSTTATKRFSTSLLQLKSEENEAGLVSEHSYDAFGNIIQTKTKYSATPKDPGSPVEVELGKPVSEATRCALFDRTSRPLMSIDPDGRVIITEYAAGVLAKRTQFGKTRSPGPCPTSESDIGPLRAALRSQSDLEVVYSACSSASCARGAIRGEVLSEVAGGLVERALTYDAYGYVTKVTEQAPGGDVLRTAERRYTPRGRLEHSKDNFGTLQSWEYDGLDRLVSFTDGSVGTQHRTVAYGYYPNDERRTETNGAAGYQREYELDALGRSASYVEHGALKDHPTFSIVREFDLEGRLLVEGDARGYLRRHKRDAFGRVCSMSVVRDDSNQSVDESVVETAPYSTTVQSFTYDVLGNVKSETDLHGLTTTYAYDFLGRRVRTTFPASKVDPTSMSDDPPMLALHSEEHRDLAGNVRRTVDVRGTTTSVTVDGRGLATSATTRGGTLPERVQQTTFDAAGRVLSEESHVGLALRLRREYRGVDVLGRPAEIQQTVADATVPDTTESFVYGDEAAPVPGGLPVVGQYGTWVQMTDARGVARVVVKDGAGRVVRQVDATTAGPAGASCAAAPALNLVRMFGYDALGRKTSETNPLGQTAAWKYSPIGPLEEETTFAGDLVQYSRDPQGRETVRTDPRKPSEYSAGLKTITKYDALGRLVSVETEQGATRTPVRSYVRTDAADAANLWSERETVGDPAGVKVEKTRKYDHAGRLLALDEGGQVTRFLSDGERETGRVEAGGYARRQTYDAFDRLVKEQEGPSSEQREQLWNYDDVANTLDEVNAVGFAVTVQFDGAGRELSRTFTNPTDGTYLEENSYDAGGNVVATTRTSPAGVVTTNRCYDAASRLVEVKGPGTNYHRTVYDALGRPTEEYDREEGPGDVVAKRTFDARGRPIREEDGAGVVTLRAYDALGLLRCAGTVTSQVSVGGPDLTDPVQALCQTPRSPRLTFWDYGALGELLTVRQPGAPADCATGCVKYGYDAARRLRSRVDAEGHRVEYEYEAARGDLRTALKQFEGQATYTWQTTYNDNREVQERRDPLGNAVTTDQYGAYHQPKQVTWSGPGAVGSSAKKLVATYDELGNPETRELERADGSRETETFTNDVQGRRRAYGLTTGGVTAGLGYGYWADGQRKQVVLPSGATNTYAYDASVRLKSTTTQVGQASYVTEQTWTAEGLPQGTKYADGSTACRVFDGGDRLSYLGHTLATVDCAVETLPFGSPLREFEYQYDGYGNRRQLNERGVFGVQSFSEEQTFAYDARDRLEIAAYGERVDVWEYDGNGNRKKETSYPAVATWKAEDYRTPPGGVSPTGSKRYGYDGRDHLTEVRDALAGNALLTRYEFDAAGRTTARTVTGTGTTTYGWGADETLGWVKDPAGVTQAGFGYDAGGLRRRKASSAPGEGDRIYLYDGTSLIAELDAATGTPKLEYVYGTELWGVIDYSASQSNPTVQWMHRDGMRSVVERTASIAGVATRVAGPFRYDAFGGYRTTPEAVQPSTDGQTKIGYTGHVFDVETGLVYAKARYYQPELGRWLSQDALEGQNDQAPSLNRYAYVFNNPYGYWDPMGEEGVQALLEQESSEFRNAGMDGFADFTDGLIGIWGLFNICSAGTISKIDAIHDQESAGDAKYQGYFGTGNYLSDVLGAVGIGALKMVAGAKTGGALGQSSSVLGMALRGAAGGALGSGGTNIAVQAAELATGAKSEFSIVELKDELAMGALWGGVGVGGQKLLEKGGAGLRPLLHGVTDALEVNDGMAQRFNRLRREALSANEGSATYEAALWPVTAVVKVGRYAGSVVSKGLGAGKLAWNRVKGKGESVYEHLDDAGNRTYIGITDDLARRAGEHRMDPTKRGTTMRPLTGPLRHGEARTIEAMLIRKQLDHARRIGLIDGTESIREQLQKAGLDNLNRGRIQSRWEDLNPRDHFVQSDQLFDI